MDAWSEKLWVLHEQGITLLETLHYIKYTLEPDLTINVKRMGDASLSYRGTPITTEAKPNLTIPRPTLVADTTFNALMKLSSKRFPDFPDYSKITGYIQLVAEQHAILQELGPYYDAIVQVVDYCDHSQQVISELNQLAPLTFEYHRETTWMLMRVISYYGKICCLVNDMGPEQNLLAVILIYSKLYQLKHQQIEPNWTRVTKFMTSLGEQPLYMLHEQLSNTSSRIIACFSQLDFKGLPSLHGQPWSESHLQQCAQGKEMAEIFLIVGLMSFGDLIKNQQTLNLFKQASCFMPFVPLVRNEFIPLQTVLEFYCKTNPKYAKYKGPLMEFIANPSIQQHRERREDLLYQLANAFAFSEDQEWLLNRLWTVTTLLQLSKDELHWYLMFLDLETMKNKKKQIIMDQSILELIKYHIQLKYKLDSLRDDIGHMLGAQLCSKLNLSFNQAVSDALRGSAVQASSAGKLIAAIRDELKNIISSERWETTVFPNTFQAVRLNWIRFQWLSASPQTTLIIPGMSEVSKFMSELFRYLPWIEQGELELQRIASLKTLYYFKPTLLAIFKDAIESGTADSLANLHVLISLCPEFATNDSGQWRTQYDQLCISSYEYCLDVCSFLGHYTALVAWDRIQTTIQMIKTNSLLIPDTIRIALKKPKNAIILPDIEGHFSSTDAVYKRIEKLSQMMSRLIFCLKQHSFIEFSYGNVTPLKYFKDHLMLFLSNYLTQCALGKINKETEESSLMMDCKRPTILLEELKRVHSILLTIDQLGQTNLLQSFISKYEELMDPQLLNQFIETCPELWQFLNATGKQVKKRSPGQASILCAYTHWYTELLANKQSYISISMNRKCLVTRCTIPTTLFTTQNELMALASMLGPEGCKAMDKRIVQVAVTVFTNVKDNMQQNMDIYLKLVLCWYDETKFKDTVRNLKNLRDAYHKVISLGVILQFRHFLHDAMKLVFSKTIPGTMFHVYSQQKIAKLKKDATNQWENLATSLGVSGYLDAELYSQIRKQVDMSVVEQNASILPYFFASIMNYMCYDDHCQFNANLGGLENNGQCIPMAFYVLTALYADFQQKDESWILQSHKEFLTATCFILNENSEMSYDNKPIFAAYFALKLWIDENPILQKSAAEKLIPYFKLQSMLADLYQARDQSVTDLANLTTSFENLKADMKNS